MKLKKHWFYTELEISEQELLLMAYNPAFKFIYKWLQRFFK